MRVLERWLGELPPSHRILDLGCGGGSLREQLRAYRVVGVDVDARELARNPDLPTACAASHRLPFAGQSFDLVICHHSLEHIRELPETLREIRRVLKREGRLFVSVPDGASFSDRLYRLVLCGGGHVQQFSFERVVQDVEAAAGLNLAGSQELFSSFVYIRRKSFVPDTVAAPLPRRVRLIGLLPDWAFSAGRLLLNVASRAADRVLPTHFARYGWAFAFGPERVAPERESALANVCMSCGAGLEAPVRRVFGLAYECPYCRGMNVYFPAESIWAGVARHLWGLVLLPGPEAEFWSALLFFDS